MHHCKCLQHLQHCCLRGMHAVSAVMCCWGFLFIYLLFFSITAEMSVVYWLSRMQNISVQYCRTPKRCWLLSIGQASLCLYWYPKASTWFLSRKIFSCVFEVKEVLKREKVIACLTLIEPGTAKPMYKLMLFFFLSFLLVYCLFKPTSIFWCCVRGCCYLILLMRSKERDCL